MSFNEQNNKRQRASSAKSSKEKVRPQSGNSAKNIKKLDFIENIYTGALTSKRQGRTAARLGYGLGEEGQHKKSVSKGYKEMEQLYEENILLKRQINNLKDQLSRQIGKTQVFRKKNSEFTKKLDLHFQKEMYWTNNNNKNMVMGIKNQYEKIKQKYQQKCQEYDQMTQQFIYSQAREDRSYIDILQKQNKKLQKRVNQAHQELRILQHGTITSIVEESIENHNKYKYELHQINQNLEDQLTNSKQEIQILSKTLEERQKKINFLQKMLLQKDNNQHAARKKLKKLQKQKQQIVQQYAWYKRIKEQKIAQSQQNQKKIKENYENQALRQGLIFKQQIEQKNILINKLQKEVAYLTTLLSYWKPLDQNNQFGGSTLHQNNSLKIEDRDVLLQYSMGSTLIKFNRSQNPTLQIKVEDDDTKSITKSIIDKSRKGSTDYNKLLQQQKNVSEVMTKSINFTKNDQGRKRVQVTAQKRQTQEGVKSRRIQQQQISDICQTLKYRFIGLNVPIEEIRNVFDYKIEENGNILDSQEEQEWKKQYITMKETIDILRSNKIFGLNEADSLSLARYLIEDSLTQYVYCDPNNENLRTVVKSIIKTAIGEYQIIRNFNELKKEAQIIIEKYETNLESALKAIAPKGMISKKKLMELIKGLGIELSQQIQNYLIGKITIKSDNLLNLKYSVLFEK